MGHIIVTMGDIKWMGRLTAANSMYDLANYKGTSSLAACISSVSTNFCSELPLSCEMPQICCIFAAMLVSFSVFCIYLPPPWLLGISLSQHTIKFMVLSVLQGLTVLCSMTCVLATMVWHWLLWDILLLPYGCRAVHIMLNFLPIMLFRNSSKDYLLCFTFTPLCLSLIPLCWSKIILKHWNSNIIYMYM